MYYMHSVQRCSTHRTESVFPSLRKMYPPLWSAVVPWWPSSVGTRDLWPRLWPPHIPRSTSPPLSPDTPPSPIYRKKFQNYVLTMRVWHHMNHRHYWQFNGCFEERNFETLDGKAIWVFTHVSSTDTLKKVFYFDLGQGWRNSCFLFSFSHNLVVCVCASRLRYTSK